MFQNDLRTSLSEGEIVGIVRNLKLSSSIGISSVYVPSSSRFV